MRAPTLMGLEKRAKSVALPAPRCIGAMHLDCAKTTLSRRDRGINRVNRGEFTFYKGLTSAFPRPRWIFYLSADARGFDMRNHVTVATMRLINAASSNAIRRGQMKNVRCRLTDWLIIPLASLIFLPLQLWTQFFSNL